MLVGGAPLVKRVPEAPARPPARSTLAPVFSRRARLSLSLVALAYGSLLFGLAMARFSSVHQRTFDLALYARIAYGLARGDAWSPITNSHVLGTHLSPVLVPLGLVGRLIATVPVLLFVQAACVSLCVFPLARIGARRLGTRGIWLAVVATLLYPNLFHVATYEFHPGTLAVLPMCWAFDAFDRANIRQLGYALLAALACREDLGAFGAVLALTFYVVYRDRRALYAALGCVAYALVGVAVTQAYAPANGSFSQHFGPWGGSPFGVFSTLFSDPARVIAHFSARERLTYLPRLLAPLSFFSLRAPHLLLPALPYVALNLISVFPTADEQYSHYLTPAVPALLVSGLVGVTEVRARMPRILWFVTLAIGHHALGGSPLSRDFDGGAFRSDAASDAARRVLAAIPAGASVQAPDPLLPHLAERHEVRRAPPPEARTRFVAIDIAHRTRYAQQEVLLRTSEEPLMQKLLARRDHALIAYEPPYALFERGRDARDGLAAACFDSAAPPSESGTPLADCLTLESARFGAGTLQLALRARGACPADLALRFGAVPQPARVSLVCEGRLSPALLRADDLVRSEHPISAAEAAAIARDGLWVGALRASGAPPAPDAPFAVPVRMQ
jgi:uncharacterized membrane protein